MSFIERNYNNFYNYFDFDSYSNFVRIFYSDGILSNS